MWKNKQINSASSIRLILSSAALPNFFSSVPMVEVQGQVDLDLKTLQVEQVSFIDTQFVQSEADLLFSVTIAGRAGYVYILFEHQSNPDAFIILRLPDYIVGVRERFQREKEKCDHLPTEKDRVKKEIIKKEG